MTVSFLPQSFQAVMRFVNRRFKRLIPPSKLILVEITPYINLMKWAHNLYQFPLDVTLTYSLARNGHYEVLKWIVDEKGCPIDTNTANNAVTGGAFRNFNMVVGRKMYFLHEHYYFFKSWASRSNKIYRMGDL